MIDKNSAQFSMDLARDAVAAGYSIVAQPNTPLAELCVTFKNTGEPLVQSMESLDEVPGTMQTLSNNSAHNDRFDYFTKLVVDNTNVHLSFVKNVVIAAIESTSKRVMAALGATELSPVAEFCIVEKSLPAPLAIVAFRDTLAEHTTSSNLEPEKQIKTSNKKAAELLDMLKTGSGVFDEHVQQWWNQKGEDFFVEVWENIFVSASQVTPNRIYTLPEIFHDPDHGIDAAIAVFLFASKLHKEPPAVSNMDATELQRIVAQHLQYAAKRISLTINDIQTAAQNGQVILNLNTLKKTITVYSPTYRAWLKDGGKPEILFGVLIDNAGDITVADLNKNRERHLHVWENFKTITLTKFKNQQYDRFIKELRTCFYQDLATAVELERSYEEEDAQHQKKITENLEKELLAVTLSDQQDLIRCVARIVSKARYYHTDAYKVIVSIDEATKLNPSLSVEDAVLMASYEYIADYVAAQMRLQ